MIKGTTKSGFNYTIQEGALDDYELLEELREIDKGNTSLIVDVIEKIIGSEQKEQLKKHVRDETGRVSIKRNRGNFKRKPTGKKLLILVCMLNTDEEALICDFAETYRIYNYKEIPCKMAAIYAKGLKENARIKMKLAGVKVTLEDMLLASIADHTKLLTWMQTEDARKGKNRPKTILPRLLGEEERKIISFETGEEFEKEWKRLTEKG